MGIGYLLINVYADNVGQPVEKATIEITGHGTKMQVTTDASGQTNKISLECPDKEFSLTSQTRVRPYATYNIKTKKEGLDTVIIEGVQILDGTTAIQDIVMQSDPLKDPPEQKTSISEHVQWGDYPPKIVVDPATQEGGGGYGSGDVLPMPIVPTYVVVHDGLPTNPNAANYFVPFADYIKNVASSEIYATWPVETLKANIYAILSFTSSRIYSEWYRSKGYAFTITSSTQYDQKYIHNRNIFVEISRVVDEIFDKFIRYGNATHPFFSQYNDGIRVNNPGWLSQWGSKDLGDQGYSAINILKYYYGYSVSLASAPFIEGVPTSFPGYNLQLGICGEPVQKLQTQLNVVRSSFPAIPIIDSADGNYGAKTKAAVEKFQSIFSLPVTGVVDFATWYRISYVFIGVSNMLAGRYEM